MATPPKRSRPDGRLKKVAVEGNIGESARLAYARKGTGKGGAWRGLEGERRLSRCFRLYLGRHSSASSSPPACLLPFFFLSSLPLLPYLFPPPLFFPSLFLV